MHEKYGPAPKTAFEAQTLPEAPCATKEFVKEIDKIKYYKPVMQKYLARPIGDDDIMQFIDTDGRTMQIVLIDGKGWCKQEWRL